MFDEQTTAQLLRRMAGLALASLLFALIPIPREQQFLFVFFRAGGLSGAVVISWIAAGLSIWAAIRIRQRCIYHAALLCVPLAVIATAYGYYFAFVQFLQASRV